jgi:hypothetical protein
MNRSSNASNPHLNIAEPTSAKLPPDKPKDPTLRSCTRSINERRTCWRVLNSDEAYRKEVAKRQF